MKQKELISLLILSSFLYVSVLLFKELDIFQLIIPIFDLFYNVLVALCFVLVFEPVIEKIPLKNRTFRCTIVYLFLFAVILFIGGLLVPVVLNQKDHLKELFQMVVKMSRSQSEQVFSYESAIMSTFQMIQGVSDLVLSYLLAYFISMETPVIQSYLTKWDFACRFFEFYEEFKEIVFLYLKALVMDVSVLFFAQLIVLHLFGVSYAVSLALGLALLNIIPYFGSLIGQLLIFFVDYLVYGRFRFLMILCVFLVQQLESNALQPVLYGKMMNIRPLYMFVSILFFGKLIGLTGVLFAPVFAVAIQFVLQKMFQKNIIQDQ